MIKKIKPIGKILTGFFIACLVPFLVSCAQKSVTYVSNAPIRVTKQSEFGPNYDPSKIRGDIFLATVELDSTNTRTLKHYDIYSTFEPDSGNTEYISYPYDMDGNDKPDFRLYYAIKNKNKKDPLASEKYKDPTYGLILDEETLKPLKWYIDPGYGLGFTRVAPVQENWVDPPALYKETRVGKSFEVEKFGRKYIAQKYDLNKDSIVDAISYSRNKKENPEYLELLENGLVTRLYRDIDRNKSFDKMIK